MSVVARRQHANSAVSVGGNLEPIEPVFTNANRQSALGTGYPIPADPAGNVLDAPIVHRGQNTAGMRYLYADIRQRQPVSSLGTGPDIGIAVWSSEFQPELGSLRSYGFFDRLYQAGYPGFNLGLSFRVAVNPSAGTHGPGHNMRMKTPNRTITVNPFKRSTTARANLKG